MKNLFRLITHWIARIISLFKRWKSNSFYPKNKGRNRKIFNREMSNDYNSSTHKFSKVIKISKYRSNSIFNNRKRHSKQSNDRKLIEKKYQTQNLVNSTVSQENQKEGDEIPKSIDPPNLNNYRLVLDRDIFKFKDQPIATSGEAEIWKVTGENLINNSQNYVAKIYHKETSETIKNLPERIKKLEVMVVRQIMTPSLSPNHVSLAWPQYLLETTSSEVVGFLMPSIEGKQLTKVYHPRLRQRLNLEWCWQVDWHFLHQTAKNLTLIIQSLHTEDYVVGDLKPENILVNEQALPSIIDIDSFQIRCYHTGQLYRCLVGSEGFTPPELLGKNFAEIDQNPTHDNFRLAVIIYHLLFGEHPFKGEWQGDGDPPKIVVDDLIRQGFWRYASHGLIKPGVRTIPLDIIHPQLKEYFLRCFNEGHCQPNVRPTATDWANALQAALDDLVQCESSSSHWYSKTYGRCYWCEREKNIQRDIFSPKTKQYKKLNKLLKERNWKEADLETKYLMLKITSRTHQGWLDESALVNFPLEDLSIINQLWLEHSSELFGFSVQKRIYLETGNQLGEYNRETYNRFGEVVGWRKDRIWKNYFDLEFSLSAPYGHLPWCCAGFDVCLVSYLSTTS